MGERLGHFSGSLWQAKKSEGGGVWSSWRREAAVALLGAERELVGEKNTESPVGSGRGRCLQGGFEAPETLFGRAKKARQKKESGGVSSSAAKRSGVGFFTPSASLFAKQEGHRTRKLKLPVALQ